MRTSEFEDLCIERLGYATNPWEIEHVRTSKEAVSETWVSCNVDKIIARPGEMSLTHYVVQMLGTALFLGVDILVFWQYEDGRGWIRYSTKKGASCREAFLIHCVHSQKYKMFHCEPIQNWRVEEWVHM